jgi:hypothetical protein
MAHAQKPDFVFRRNGRVHLNRQGRQLSRLLAAELCTSACWVCTARASPCSAVMWRLLVTHSICLFPLHFSSPASPCATTFQMQSTYACVSLWFVLPDYAFNTGCNRKQQFSGGEGGGGVKYHTHFGKNLLFLQIWMLHTYVPLKHVSLYQTTIQQPILIITAIRTLYLKLSITMLLTCVLIYLLHEAESFLRS